MLLLIILAVLIIAEVALFAYDRYITSFIVMIASIAAAYFFVPIASDFIKLHWVKIVAEYVPIYLVIGIGIATAKWVWFLRCVGATLKYLKSSFVTPVDVTEKNQAEYDAAVAKYKTDLINWEQSDAYRRNNKPKEPAFFDPTPYAAIKNYAFYEHVKDKYGITELLRGQPKVRISNVRDFTKVSLTDVFTPRARDYIQRITFWVLQWPIVVLSTIVEDLILNIGTWVAQTFDTLFHNFARKIIGNAVKDI